MTSVLDASVVLAWLFGEPGVERVDEVLAQGGVMHTVNWAEVLTKLTERQLSPQTVEADRSS